MQLSDVLVVGWCLVVVYYAWRGKVPLKIMSLVVALACALAMLLASFTGASAQAGVICPSETITNTVLLDPGYAVACSACLPDRVRPTLPGVTPIPTRAATATPGDGCFIAVSGLANTITVSAWQTVTPSISGIVLMDGATVIATLAVGVPYQVGPLADPYLQGQGYFTAEVCDFVIPTPTPTPTPTGGSYQWVNISGDYVHNDSPSNGNVKEGEFITFGGAPVCGSLGYDYPIAWSSRFRWDKTTQSSANTMGYGVGLSADGQTINPGLLEEFWVIGGSGYNYEYYASASIQAFPGMPVHPLGWAVSSYSFGNPSLLDVSYIYVSTYDLAGSDPLYMGAYTTANNIWVLCYSDTFVSPTPTPTPTPEGSIDCSTPVYIDDTDPIAWDGGGYVGTECYQVLPELVLTLPWAEDEILLDMPGFELCVEWYSVPTLDIMGVSLPLGNMLSAAALSALIAAWLRL